MDVDDIVGIVDRADRIDMVVERGRHRQDSSIVLVPEQLPNVVALFPVLLDEGHVMRSQ